MPFGVELPENFGTEVHESQSPEGAKETSSPTDLKSLEKVSESTQSEITRKTEQELLDLDKLERFRFAGKEWTPKGLRDSQLMREDYTKKTMEVAEARKYAENFGHDLEVVLRDPSKLAQLRSVYPKAYADLAEQYLKRMSPGAQQSSTPNEPENPYAERIAKLENFISNMEQQNYQSEVKRIDTWLDATYQKLGKKYDDADSEVVSARAEVLAQSGQKIDETVLEKLYKQHDTEMKARYEKKYKSKVDEQLTTGSKGKDIGAGGGMPGSAPKGFKTIKEAKTAFLNELDNSRSL